MSAAVYPTDWNLKVAFMRDNGATSAEWATLPNGGGESLIAITIAPLSPAVDDDRTQPTTTSPQELERQQREQRRALASRASGGPVRRLSEDAG